VLYDATGTWTVALLFLLGTLVVLVGAATVACRPVMLEDTWGPRAAR
jgi:CP family cyanate transporter-like MFS transporter